MKLLAILCGFLSPLAAECGRVAGDRILAGDLARVAPQFSAVEAGTEVGYAPALGVRRVMDAAELQALARRFGIAAAARQGVCFERESRTLDRTDVAAAVEREVRAWPEGERIRWELVDHSSFPVPEGTLEFSRRGVALPARGVTAGPVLWRGVVRPAAGAGFPVWARVRLSVRRPVLVAARVIEAQSPLTAESVRVEEREEFPLWAAPLAALEGGARIARRTIRNGEAIFPAMLAAPRDIERGALIEVTVENGGAHLTVTGRAETAARRGDTVLVRNPETGRRFQARASGPNQAVLRLGKAQEEIP